MTTNTTHKKPKQLPPNSSLAETIQHGLNDFIALPENSYMRALRSAVMLALPLLLIGACALLIKNFPVEAYQRYMNATFGTAWLAPLDLIYNTSVDILALAISLSLSSCLIETFNEKHPTNPVNKTLGVLTSLSCLMVMIGPQVVDKAILLSWIGLRGFFASIVITSVAVYLFLALFQVRKLRLMFYAEEYDPLLPQVFASILPVTITILFFVLVRFTLIWANIPSVHEWVYNIMRMPFTGVEGSFGVGALYTVLIQVCWFLGIHGPDLLEPMVQPIFEASMAANSLAHNSNLPAQHLYTKYLFDTFVWLGGSGSTLGLVLAIFLRSKDKGSRRIATIALGPSIFNINEIFLFGLPIVFNPMFLIPFVFVPLVMLCTSVLAISNGFVPFPLFETKWTTPPLINAYISTGSWRGVALQLVNLTIATAMYMPFVTLADKKKERIRQTDFTSLVRKYFQNMHSSTKTVQAFANAPIPLVISLGEQLRSAIENNSSDLFLRYQPRINMVAKSVSTVEALLSWHHPLYGPIPPQLVLSVAEHNGIGNKLDAHILHKGLLQLAVWRRRGLMISLALHVTELQLNDKDFVPQMLHCLRLHELPPDSLILEISEKLALNPTAKYVPILRGINENGIRISIDDFGRNFQSLSYLKRLPITDLHLHKALVENIVYSKSCQDILVAVQKLCSELHITPTVEYVESKEQLETLLELDFSTFQGFWFKEPVTAEVCEEFIENYGKQ